MESKQKQSDVAQYTIQDLLPVALVFVVTGIAIAFGANVVGSVRSGFTANTTEWNISNDALLSLDTISDKLTLVATVVVAAVIIGVIVRSFGGVGGN